MTKITKSSPIIIFLIVLGAFFFIHQNSNSESNEDKPNTITLKNGTANILPSLFHNSQQIPEKKILQSNFYITQTFNNCGPASLSLALSYFGITKTQEELGEALRPYQSPIGDNDDKSVTLEELASKAKEFNLLSFHRPNGTIPLLKEFIAADIPVITRTLFHSDDDIGHYRVIKGYDETTQTIIQDDSMQGQNLSYSYEEFNALWKKFNYEYVVLVPKEKEDIAKRILGTNIDEKTAWENAITHSQETLKANPEDTFKHFNLSVAYYKIQDYQNSVEEFEKAENSLPKRTLWYQIEPVEAYYEIGNYEKVFALSDSILNDENRAFSELYILKGKIYLKQGSKEKAKEEFEKAVLYNKNLKEAQELLRSI